MVAHRSGTDRVGLLLFVDHDDWGPRDGAGNHECQKRFLHPVRIVGICRAGSGTVGHPRRGATRVPPISTVTPAAEFAGDVGLGLRFKVRVLGLDVFHGRRVHLDVLRLNISGRGRRSRARSGRSGGGRVCRCVRNGRRLFFLELG